MRLASSPSLPFESEMRSILSFSIILSKLILLLGWPKMFLKMGDVRSGPTLLSIGAMCSWRLRLSWFKNSSIQKRFNSKSLIWLIIILQ